MAESWIGHVVSVDCGDLGTYQGHVHQVNNSEQTITLTKSFRNGVPYQAPEVTIDARNIRDLTILKAPGDHSAINSNQNARSQAESTKSIPTYRRSPDIRKVQEQSKRSGSPAARMGSPNAAEVIRKRTNSSSECRASPRRQQSTPRKIEGHSHRKPKEDAFSTPVDSFMEDFDFEKNLAMFDKQAVFDEMNQSNPVVVKAGTAKYRCDENVLQSAPPVLQQIKLPDGEGGQNLYVTDTDLVIPSVSAELRERLFTHAESLGYTTERQLETVGRSVSEMVLTLLGGVHRLNPKNSHQRPTVVILCGPHRQGAQGINCARHLANRQVKTLLYMPNFVHQKDYISHELLLYSHTTGKRVTSTTDLPQNPVDIIVSCLDNAESGVIKDMPWYSTIVDWSNKNKAPVLCLDPPIHQLSINTKWSLCTCLPLSFTNSCGALYLCDMGFGSKVFKDLNIKYVSPFGHKFVIPLHSKSPASS